MNRLDNVDSIIRLIEYVEGTKEWENLQDKTQVFNDRVSSTVKSRGSHSTDVGDIASKLCELLGADEVTVEKARLIGIMHDLGHITYGHAGETVATDIIENYEFTEEEKAQIIAIRKSLFGDEYVEKSDKNICFEHNENSVLQYIAMCNRFGYEIDEEVVIGILSHSTSRYKDLPLGVAQQAVRLADKLAYINYDVDDLHISFQGKEEELAALDKLYKQDLLDPNGAKVKISLPNGKNYTLHEFLTELSSADRIEIFINASVEDAKKRIQNRPEKYEGYETILTGCNDLAVQMATLRKVAKKAEKAGDLEKAQQCLKDIDILKKQLYERSPILYAAYEIKERSDNFIRAGVGLSTKSQVDRATQSLSSIGNKDLLNEYIYKSLVTYLQREIKSNKSLTEEQIINRYRQMGAPQEYIDLYFEYVKFKKEQDNAILGLPNNNGYTFPEIYTIINFIGLHSNTELTNLARLGNLINHFNTKILPEIQELLDNEKFYIKETGLFTKEGNQEREKLVSTYGANPKLEFGLEEENQSSMSKDESIMLAMNAGYLVPDFVPKGIQMIKEQFDEARKKAEEEHIESIKMIIENQKEEQLESSGKRR